MKAFWWKGLGLVLAPVAGWFTVSALFASSEEPRDPILAALKTRVMNANLQPGQPLQTTPVAVVSDPTIPRRIAFWTQAFYEGEVSLKIVEILINSGKAEALEHQLKSRVQEELEKAIHSIEQDLQDAALLCTDEYEVTMQRLRADPTRHIVIKTRPEQEDPRWPEVEEARKSIQKKRKGMVAYDFLLPEDKSSPHDKAPLIFFLVRWKEWPILSSLRREYMDRVLHRMNAVRDWISERFRREGMEMFAKEKK